MALFPPSPDPIAERIDAARALHAGLACWAAFAAIWLAMEAGWLAGIDRALLLAWRTGPDLAARGHPRVLEAVRDTTALGGVFPRLVVAALAVGALALLRRYRLAAWLAGTVAGGLVVGAVLKALVARARPDFLPFLMPAHGYSFPSGHSFNGTISWLATAIAFAPLIARQPIRIALLLGALGIGAAVAVSRVLLGVHFPSDVLAGWLGAVGWCGLAAAWLARYGAGGRAQTSPGRGTVKRDRTAGS